MQIVYPMMPFLLICTHTYLLHAIIFLEGYKGTQETGNSSCKKEGKLDGWRLGWEANFSMHMLNEY